MLALAAGSSTAPDSQAEAAMPAVELRVDVRVIDEAKAAGHGDYTVNTRGAAVPPTEALQLQVHNGQRGTVQLGRALPVQWLQGAARGAAASAPAERAGAVAYAVTWVSAGQSLSVRPQWAGGDSPVRVELQFTLSTLQPAPAAPLPGTGTLQAASTLRVPLGVWTSFAATGSPQAEAQPGRASTLSLADSGRQLLQVRVTLP
jgi:hypothetical protein